MNSDALFNTQDYGKLREVALVRLSAERERILALRQRTHEPEEALKLARQARFGHKCGAFTGEQRQLAEEDFAADRACITRQLRELRPERDAPKTKPVRAVLRGSGTIMCCYPTGSQSACSHRSR